MSCPQTMASISPSLGSCAFKPGQIYRILFQKVFLTGSTKNGVALADADDVATFSALLALATEAKAIATGIVGGGKVTAGQVKEFGGGNETPGGAPIPMGKGASKFEGKMYQAIPTAIAELKKLESVEGLGVYFVTHNNKVIGKKETISSVDKLLPIPLESFPYFQDTQFGELENPSENVFGFYLPENWSDTMEIVDCVGIKDIKN